ncbi:M15 family metallopeptidase [Agromyces sp. SYSU T0242]|uniref:M15 family metallopeptidase n=1 Tax=Agromyces litoreus TaxID=3158561 RepID=UPI00339365A0
MGAATPPSPRVRRNRLIVVVAGVAVIGAVAAGAAIALTGGGDQPTPTPVASATPTPTPTPSRPAPVASTPPVAVDTFDRDARSIDDPASIWVVVDKLRPLDPLDYEPADLVSVPVAHTWEPLLRAEASDAIVRMFRAASEEAGLALASNSAYRSYSTQQSIYDGDDTLTARPGYSEHQTGLTMDIGPESGNCSLDVCLADTPEGVWLRDNAYRFGFILRYPADKVGVTGYQFEPWHFRYVGTDLAQEMHDTGVTTLEEFFGLAPAPEYG